jgi:hypothetical protein
MQTTSIFSLGQIARECGAAEHRIRYVIASRGLKPICRVGHIRGFSSAQMALIKRTVAEIDERRQKDSAS